jgi:hypothetical protein
MSERGATVNEARSARSGMDNSPEISVLAQSNTRQIQVLAKLGQHQSTV